MAEYATVIGFIQFDIDTDDVNGQEVRRVTVRSPGSEGKLIRITVWPEHEDVELEKGDFIAVDGEFTTRTGQNKDGDKVTYFNVSAKRIAVLGTGEAGAEREVVQKPAKRAF